MTTIVIIINNSNSIIIPTFLTPVIGQRWVRTNDLHFSSHHLSSSFAFSIELRPGMIRPELLLSIHRNLDLLLFPFPVIFNMWESRKCAQ